MRTKKITVTRTMMATISRCYGCCPYFVEVAESVVAKRMKRPPPQDDDYTVMICEHPAAPKENGCKGLIIEHPDCDQGFPKKCPLIKEPEAKRKTTSKKTEHPLEDLKLAYRRGGTAFRQGFRAQDNPYERTSASRCPAMEWHLGFTMAEMKSFSGH